MTMTPEFRDAKLYTCGDYHHGPIHTSVEETIRERLESNWDREDPIEEQCERLGDLVVLAHNPEPISSSWVDARIDQIMESFEESFAMEYGASAGQEAYPWTKDTREWAKTVLTANLTKSIRSAIVTATNQVGSQTFTVAECIEMMK